MFKGFVLTPLDGFIRNFPKATCEDKYNNTKIYYSTLGAIDFIRPAIIIADKMHSNLGYKNLDQILESRQDLAPMEKFQITAKIIRYFPLFQKYFDICDQGEDLIRKMKSITREIVPYFMESEYAIEILDYLVNFIKQKISVKNEKNLWNKKTLWEKTKKWKWWIGLIVKPLLEVFKTFREDLKDEKKECMAEIKEGMLTIWNKIIYEIIMKHAEIGEIGTNADEDATDFFTTSSTEPSEEKSTSLKESKSTSLKESKAEEDGKGHPVNCAYLEDFFCLMTAEMTQSHIEHNWNAESGHEATKKFRKKFGCDPDKQDELKTFIKRREDDYDSGSTPSCLSPQGSRWVQRTQRL
jgi:hypothetical protein